jgi:hypothetical protein
LDKSGSEEMLNKKSYDVLGAFGKRLRPRYCGSSKMPQHFLEPAMPLAMAASPMMR